MAYQTGTINAITDVTGILDTFLLANGWTKTAQSVNVTNCSPSTPSAGNLANISTANNFSSIPTGAKITWPGLTQNVYLAMRTGATTIVAVFDAIYTNPGTTTITFTWNTYTKGTKNFNFAPCRFLMSAGVFRHFILGDMYHLGTGNHGLNGNQGLPAVRFEDGELPCTYDLFQNTNPDVVSMVFSYGANQTQHFHFGDLKKVHSSGFVGGEFFTASSYTAVTGITPFPLGISIADTTLTLAGGSGGLHGNSVCFGATAASSCAAGIIHVEIDGLTYIAPVGGAGAAGTLALGQSSITKWNRGLNQWNSQITLIVPEIYFTASSNFYMLLGVMEHLRLVRVDNYNSRDEETLGTDVWKIYPLAKKNAANRSNDNLGTGTLGFAVRKV